MKKYVYPKLPAVKTFSYFRVGGNGLANCLFVFSRALILADKYECELISPTWFNISLGPYLRFQKDKRHYLGIFKQYGIIGLKKLFILSFCRKTNNSFDNSNSVIVVEGLQDYFASLLSHQEFIKDKIFSLSKIIIEDSEYNNYIAIHIRLGDYVEHRRTSIEWYINMINKIKEKYNYKFLLFSDGRDDELQEILSLGNITRVYFGNALADILVMSKSLMIIGSDSTFSGWACFLGQKPCIFNTKHFGRILIDENNEYILSTNDDFPSNLVDFLKINYKS